MNCTTKLQVSAESDCKVVQTAVLTTNGQRISQGLSRVGMATITGIDNGNIRVVLSHKWGTLFAMTHSDNIGKASNNTHSIGYRLALAH